MFEHSVKVPRQYKIAANIVKKVSTEGGSVKTLLYDDKLRHFKTNVLYALITETIKHAARIDKIFESCNILVNEPRLDPWLAKVLTTELLFGKKTFPGKSTPELKILSYKEQFETYTSAHQDDFKTEVVIRRPRYVRINTNLLTTSDAIRAFQDEGYRFIRCTSGSYSDYLEQIQGLTEYDFTQDYHVKTIFVFSSGTKFHEHDLYLENQIILQDKATAMAVHLLAPPPGSVALDMCAAPGMKTTQLAAFIRNEGKIYAVERNEKRYQTLCDFVERTGSKCVETVHKDALEIKRGDFDDVEYIILDPSCSGSGMELSVHNYIEETRLAKLTSLQEKFLKHAMNAFPNAKRIVYSTCSLFPEENERVITNVVKTSRTKWRVQDVKELLKGQWNNFGSGMYGSMGARCMYAKPDTDFTTGFFLAVLDRDQKDFEKCQKREESLLNGQGKSKEDEEVNVDKKDKKRKLKADVGIEESQLEDRVEMDNSKKKKKKEHDKSDGINDNIETMDNQLDFKDDTVVNEVRKKKKKKDKRKESEAVIDDSQDIDTVTEDNDVNETKKKKKRKNATEDIESQTIEESQTTKVDKGSTKKKKKRKHSENVDTESKLESENVENTLIESTKKKKKKKRDINLANEGEN